MDDAFVERMRRALAPDYVVQQVLPNGGMGIVVVAHEFALNRLVAVKTIRPELATAVNVERFLREARTLAMLPHPNIVPIHALQERDGLHCIVMEYIPDETLAQRLERGSLPRDRVVRLGRDILAALEFAHAHGVIHRDIKPSNIFLRPDRALLADFGISKDLGPQADAITRTGSRPMTEAYASPEQRWGAEVGFASDLYSLAAVLYEAQTGRAWYTPTPIDPAAADWSGVPGDLKAALQPGLALAPGERWPSAEAFAKALRVRRRTARRVAAVAALAVGLLAATGPWWVPVALRWIRGPTPTLADVSLGRCGPADAGARLRTVAYEILLNAKDLALAPLVDNDGATSSSPGAKYDVSCRVDHGDSGLRVVLQVGSQHKEVQGEPGEFEWNIGQKIALAVLEVVKPNAFVAPACKPQSVESYNAFMKGQEAFRRDDWSSAIEHFEEALARDPEYCLAEVRLWLAQRWSRRPITLDLVHLLAHNGANLAKEDSLLIAAELAPTRTRRWELYREATSRHLFRAVAPLQYGGDLTHRGPLDGIPLDSGVAVLREARERDPQLASIHDQLVWALVRMGNRDSAYAALQELERHARVVRDVHPAIFRLIWHMRFQPLDRPPDLSAAGPVGADQMAQRVRLALSFDLAPYQALIGGRLAGDSTVSFGMRAHGRTARGLAWLALGRPAAGLRELDSAAAPGIREDRVPALQAAQWYLLAASLGIPGAPDSGVAAAAARTTTERLIDDSALGGRAAWTLAVEAWQRRDTTAARAWADRIPPRDSALRAIAAAIDSGRRAPRRALDLTTPLRGVREEQNGLGEPFARAILHLRRAEWYAAIGESENAERELRWHENSDFIGWLQGPIQSAEVDWVAGAYVRVREGMRRVDAGDLDGCADLRRMVDTLWIEVESGVDSLRRAGQAKAGACL